MHLSRSARRLRSLAAGRTAVRRDDGVTLIEVVIAAVLLGILSSAILGVMLQTQSSQQGNRARVAAANLAAREIDLVREEFMRNDAAPLAIAAMGTVTNPHQLDEPPGAVAGQPLIVDGTPYTVVRSVAWNITGGGSSACDGGSLVAYPTMSVTVSVTWPNMGSIKPVVSTAVFAPEKGNGIPGTASFVAVQVTDASGAPNPGRGVRVTGGSEVKTALTDSSGCAVVQVNPATGLGTNYTAELTDLGYVDISGSSSPSKIVGMLTQGQLNNNVTFAYDKAGTIILRLIDEVGNPIDPATVVGEVTLAASESSGGTNTTSIPMTGSSVIPPITNLWPTQYGAYFGSIAPTTGYTPQVLAPGATLTLDVPVVMGTGTVAGTIPTGTSQMWMVPAGAGTCTSPKARPLGSPYAYTLLPGEWDFFAVTPQVACSPGPDTIAVNPGPNDVLNWDPTTLKVNGVPPGGTLWALDKSKASPTPGTCPTGPGLAQAQNIDAARTGFVDVAAGDRYFFVTNGPANGTCLSAPAAINPSQVAYASANEITWTPSPVSLTITALTKNRYVIVSQQPLKMSGGNPVCAKNDYTLASGVTSNTTIGQVPGSQTMSTTIANGTWYVYQWNRANGVSVRCSAAGTVNATGFGPYTLNASTKVVTP